MKKIILLLAITISSSSLLAATYTTLTNGNWMDANNVWSLNGSTPCGCTPGALTDNDIIIINHDITADQDIELTNNSLLTLNTNGSFESGAELAFTNSDADINGDVTVNKFLVNTGSTINLNSAILTISARVDIYGIINIDGGYTLMQGGNVEVHPGAELNLDNNGKLDVQGGNITNSGTIDLCLTCCTTTSGNWRNNVGGQVIGSGAARSEAGNMRNFGFWAPTVAWCSAGNAQGMPGFENCFSADATCNFVVLPVEFSGIQATSSAEGIPTVLWQTNSERDNDYFVVYRRTDSEDWKELGTVKGAGTTTEAQEYSFEDATAASGNNYYKIKQVDYNGATTDSEVVSIRVERNAFVVAPNPASKTTNIKLYNVRVNSTLELLSVSGNILWSMKATDNVTSLPVSSLNLEGGVYIVRNTSEQQTQSERIVIY